VTAPEPPIHFFDLTREQLRHWMAEHGLQGFRAKQLCRWVYQRHVVDTEAMTDFSKRDRRVLAERMRFRASRTVQHQTASDGTEKRLVRWSEGPPALETECVMIPAESRDSGRMRRTACISSQVGCPVGCRFCASGLGGLDANLTTGQILEQVHVLNTAGAEPITHIVFMGMGEPLSNFNAVVGAVRTLNADWGFGIGGRRITISTVGLPNQMRRLADQLEVPITLAISLHAPSDDLRRQLIPWAESTSVQSILNAGRYYFEKTGREITLEYILLRGVNDRVQHAKQLADVARSLRANVNLIRYNEVADLPFERPGSDDVLRFQQTLRQAGLNAHIRASRGRDIAAACGQLRHENAAHAAP